MRKIILLLVLLAFLIPLASATETNITSAMSVTCKGTWPLVSLGIERVVSVTQATVYYNWISIGILFSIGAMASMRTTRFFAILVPIFAALLVFFQWLNGPNAVQTWAIIVVTAVLAAAIYMKGSLHERFGMAGPGSMVFNVLFYILILQSVVGFVNATAIWDYNAAYNQFDKYSSIDVTSQVTTIGQQGGGLDTISQVGAILTDMTIGAIRMFISMVASIAVFSVVLGIVFPWIPGSGPIGIALLALLQLGVYIIYYMAYLRFVKPTIGEMDF